MTNGCICCTLRGDLAEEVGRLAAAGCYDYCVIESTGIGEPMQARARHACSRAPHGKQPARRALQPRRRAQPSAGLPRRQQPRSSARCRRTALAPSSPPPPQVAETFAMAAEEGGPPLSEVARLDTCVTVVDAANLMANL